MQTVFLTAFFGGPLATVSIATANSMRLQRFGRDLPALLAMLVVTVGGMWWLLRTPSGAAAQDWLQVNFGNNYERLFTRLLGLTLVVVPYFLHRREDRNATLVGLDRPDGWTGGIVSAGIGVVGLMALVALIERI